MVTRPDGQGPGRLPDAPGVLAAAVHAHPDQVAPGAWPCPAKSTGNRCDTCRACWDRSVALVSYPLT